AINAATTRQNVSLRRILRRSTMTSESSDIENSPGGGLSGDRTVIFRIPLISRALITSIAVQYEENKAPNTLSPCVLGRGADVDGSCFLGVDTALILLASTKTDGHV